MIEEISLVIANESGETVKVRKTTKAQIEIRLETIIADVFSQICYTNNTIADDEIKIHEKFLFAQNLQNYLQEMTDNASH